MHALYQLIATGTLLSLASANFHVVNYNAHSYKEVGSRGNKHTVPRDWSNLAYMPSNQYGCDWLKKNFNSNDFGTIDNIALPAPQISGMSNLPSFTSQKAICGVPNMQFTLATASDPPQAVYKLFSNGKPAGYCYATGNIGNKHDCTQQGSLTYWFFDPIWCDSYACKGTGDP